MELKDPKITWLVKKAADTSYSEVQNFYAGAYTRQNEFVINFEIWNNRYGLEDIQNLTNFGIAISFGTVEDSALLQYMIFAINDNELITPTTLNNEIVLEIPDTVILKGKANDGSTNFIDNYMTLTVTIKIPENVVIKNNDLKDVSFDIVRL